MTYEPEESFKAKAIRRSDARDMLEVLIREQMDMSRDIAEAVKKAIVELPKVMKILEEVAPLEGSQ